MYIFPRQFGLHNAFTSVVDSSQTSQKFQDYTIREEEISAAIHTVKQRDPSKLPKIPKRLRGEAKRLVRQLQINHKRCSYHELLQHYCPFPIDTSTESLESTKTTSSEPPPPTQTRLTRSHPKWTASRKCQQSAFKIQASHIHETISKGDTAVTDLACTGHHVSIFCRAVLSTLIPSDFWGIGETGHLNHTMFFEKMDHFLSLRRFETMNLHELVQGIKVRSLVPFIIYC